MYKSTDIVYPFIYSYYIQWAAHPIEEGLEDDSPMFHRVNRRVASLDDK